MVADYIPAAPPPLRLRDNTGGQVTAYGVNAPGRSQSQRSTPLTSAELRQTFGAVGNVFFSGIAQNEEYVRELDGERAIDTYERMWKSDGQCAALMNVYLLPLLQATYSIQAASDDAEDVAIAQETSDNLLHGMSGTTWHNTLRQLYLFRGIYGHAVFEKCWTLDPQKRIRLKKLAPRLAKTLYRWYPNEDDELDRIEQRVWVTDPNGITGAYEFPIIPAQKLLLSTRNRVGNNFLGVSLYRPCYKHWFYKDQLYAIDGVAAAKNAMGVPTFKENMLQPDMVRQQSDRTIAANSLAAYQANERAYFIEPYGWDFDLKAVSGQVRNIMPSIEHHDLLIARSFLAQFINVDSGGTLIAARDSSSFFLEALTGEADEVSDDINPLIREMEEYNHRRDRYSTLQMQGLDQRDLDQYLRGIAGLVSAGGIDADASFKSWIRDYIDAPAPDAAMGDGSAGVDPGSQGPAQEGAEDAAARQAAAGIADAGPAELRRLRRDLAEFMARDRARAQRAQTIVDLAARRSLKRSARREGLVTVPRAGGEVIELTKRGGRWEPYSRQRRVWQGVTFDPSVGEFGQREDLAGRAVESYTWRLGDGGKSGSHCPACVALAQGSPYAPDALPTHPRDGDTYCGDACSCRLVPKYKTDYRTPQYPAWRGTPPPVGIRGPSEKGSV